MSEERSERLLSFDVGIKNLAYCILDLSQNTIVDWSVLNLCETSNSTTSPSQKCNHTLQNGKCCSSNAKYHKTNEYYACEKHAKSSTRFTIPNKEYSTVSLKKRSVEELVQIKQQFHITESHSNKKELLQLVSKFVEKTTWETIAKVKKGNASKLDLITIGRSLHRQLTENPIMKTVTHVIIENQISPIANRMKTIQGMLAQYYISLGVSSIEFVSSSNKLKDFVKQSEAKTSYKQNKHDGIFYGEKLLREKFGAPEPWVELFKNSPKKDDLADCFLQGLWWWEKHLSSSNKN
jgi:hypothetical protein